jgi:hypothetical protein
MLCLVATSAAKLNRPRLVVGIVVDQMREDFLFRYFDQYGPDGFKRILKDGFTCRNVHYNYVPTITAVGHASLWSGTTPRYHGIVGNAWYDRSLQKVVYCVEDTTVQIVGNNNVGTTMGISTRNLLPTNLADELKLATNMKGKVISLSLKDRAAALSSGHMADGVYWLDLISGNFVTSTFFAKALPPWLTAFNARQLPLHYLDQTWNLLLPKEQYPYSLDDDNPYEEIPRGKDRPVFPYSLKDLSPLNPPKFEVVNRSPWGNTLVADLAIEALHQEKLGLDEHPDLLQISFSSTDAVGHFFGPFSLEINDTYLRLDRELGRLMKALDQQVGKGNYVLFLTADHGVGDNPTFLSDHQVPTGDLKILELGKQLKGYLNKVLGQGHWVDTIRNEMVYLDRPYISRQNRRLSDVQDLVAEFLMEQKGVFQTLTATRMEESDFSNPWAKKMQNGQNAKRCGDVRFVLDAGWCADMYMAATHSAPQNPDSHVPLLFYGNKIPKGVSYVDHAITDLAPTVSMMLDIKRPSACIGTAIPEVLKKY